MSDCVVRMEMPKSCKNCHFRFHMYCGLAKKDIFPEYILLENRPYWCPILCQLPEGHGRLVDADALMGLMLERKRPLSGADGSKDRYRYMQWIADFNAIEDAKTIVPAERRET